MRLAYRPLLWAKICFKKYIICLIYLYKNAKINVKYFKDKIMDILYNLLMFIGGLGAFLLSVKLVSGAMQVLVGSKLKTVLQKLSKNKYKGIGMGAVATIMLQSSTAVIVLIVSLIQTGVLTFSQSFAIILGVNIGAGITIATLLFGSIKLGTIFASLTGVGAFIMSLCRKETTKQIGQAIMAFGLLFLSLNIMSDCMSYFNTLPAFEEFISRVNTPIVMVLFGFVLCALVQSSLAGSAVILSLCGGLGVAGVIDIQSALWIAIGVKISPSITILMSSVGASVEAKKASWFYTFISALSGVAFILLYFTGWTYWLEDTIKDPALLLVVYNIGMTLLGSLILLPFSKQCANILDKIFKKKKDTNVFVMDNATLHMAGSALVQYAMQADLLLVSSVNLVKSVYEFDFGECKLSKRDTLQKNLLEMEKNCKLMQSNIIISMGDVAEADKKKMMYYSIIADRVKSIIHRAEKINEVMHLEDKDNFTSEQIEKINDLYSLAIELSTLAKQSVKSASEDVELDEAELQKIMALDEKLVKEKLSIKKTVRVDKRFKNLDAYARVINELEQIGEQFASISLAFEKEKNEVGNEI